MSLGWHEVRSRPGHKGHASGRRGRGLSIRRRGRLWQTVPGSAPSLPFSSVICHVPPRPVSARADEVHKLGFRQTARAPDHDLVPSSARVP
jgi:hypothetical protein